MDANGAVSNIDKLIKEVQSLRSSVDGLMKLNPFQGMIEQSIITNKELLSMNANLANLTSEIRNAFKGNSVQQLNKELTNTKKPVDNIVILLDELQKELKACGNVDIAKSVEKFEQKLKASKSTAEDLMNSLNKKIKGKYNQETADYFDKQLFIGEQNEVFTFLQELQKELSACGDIDTAKSVKEFEQQLHKTVSTSEEQIGKIKNKIDTLFSPEDGEKFIKSLEPKQAEITIDTVIKQLQELQRQYASIGDTKTSSAVSEYLKQLKTDTIDFEGQLQSLKANLGVCLGTEEVEKFEQSFKKAFEPPSEIELLTTKLKEVEQQLRACGETAKANKIKEYMQETQKKTIDVDSSINELRADIEKCFGTDAVNDFNKKLNETDNKVKNVSKSNGFGSNLKTALGIGTVALGIRKAVGFLQEATTESIDFVETQNLFNVSMGKTVDQYGNLDREASKYYTKAIAFQEKLSDRLKINIEESMEYQALFNAMSKSMGIEDEPSYKISENFTKLGYDLSSLYNIDPENAMQKLRAGLSGQTKPLRDLGLDITQQSLEPLLDELGIERSVKQLSQAEKMIARYIVVLRQASLAHGDFAKTMDSPANQLRIFNAQITAFKRNMGNLWQGLLGNILPYVNAIMMVINELLKMVAKLFGFEVSDQNVNISAEIGADDLADDLGIASGKAKELKKQLMGFDEINNITLQDNTSSSSGGASVGGIDQRLLDAMKEYDNLMDTVKSKANDIRDKILDWLGVTDGTYKNLKLIVDVAETLGGIFLSYKVSTAILNFFDKLGVLSKDTNIFRIGLGIGLSVGGATLLYKGIEHAIDIGTMDGQSIMETLSGGALLSTGGALTFKKPTFLKIGFLATFDIILAASIITWWNEYFEEQKQLIYGDKKELNLFEIIQVGFSAIGEGAVKSLGIEEVTNKLTNWLAEEMKKAGSTEIPDLLYYWGTVLNKEFQKWGQEKWQELIKWLEKKNVELSTWGNEKWKSFVSWFTQCISDWWTENVVIWFTKEKWEDLSKQAREGIESKFNEFKENFKPIEDWWNEKIVPWFNWNKWKEKSNEGTSGITTSFDEWKNKFNPVSNWWNSKISPWFTWEKWHKLGQDAISAIQSAFSDFDLKIKMPHFEWSKNGVQAPNWAKGVLEALNLPTTLPKLNVSWYKNGGLPSKGELFVAREAGPELVGRMGNKNAVANNWQIIDGIKQGVYEAVAMAMSQQRSGASRVEVVADEKGIFRVVQTSAREYRMQTGESAFE